MLTFVTVNEAAREVKYVYAGDWALKMVLKLLIAERDENQVYDHVHPEVAMPMQVAIDFLQAVTNELPSAKRAPATGAGGD